MNNYYTYAPKHNYCGRELLKATVQKKQTGTVTGYYIMFSLDQIFACVSVYSCVCEPMSVGWSDNGLRGSSENIMVSLNISIGVWVFYSPYTQEWLRSFVPEEEWTRWAWSWRNSLPQQSHSLEIQMELKNRHRNTHIHTHRSVLLDTLNQSSILPQSSPPPSLHQSSLLWNWGSE